MLLNTEKSGKQDKRMFLRMVGEYRPMSLNETICCTFPSPITRCISQKAVAGQGQFDQSIVHFNSVAFLVKFYSRAGENHFEKKQSFM